MGISLSGDKLMAMRLVLRLLGFIGFGMLALVGVGLLFTFFFPMIDSKFDHHIMHDDGCFYKMKDVILMMKCYRFSNQEKLLLPHTKGNLN